MSAEPRPRRQAAAGAVLASFALLYGASACEKKPVPTAAGTILVERDFAADLPTDVRARVAGHAEPVERSVPLGFGNEAEALALFHIAEDPETHGHFVLDLRVRVERNDAYVLGATINEQTGRRGVGFLVDRGTPDRPLFTTTFTVTYRDGERTGSRTFELYGDGRHDVLDGPD